MNDECKCHCRLYFRCSYREDRHCQASKLLQQVTHDDPPLFEVTYMHEHTCNASPVPNPGVQTEDEPPAASLGWTVLSFGASSSSSSAGGHHHHRRDARLQLQGERRQHQRSPSPFFTKNLHFSNNSQQHAFPSSVPPPTTSSWSPSFPIIESSLSSPTPPWTDEDDILTWDWDSSTYDLDDHLQLGDNVQLSAGNIYSTYIVTTNNKTIIYIYDPFLTYVFIGLNEY